MATRTLPAGLTLAALTPSGLALAGLVLAGLVLATMTGCLPTPADNAPSQSPDSGNQSGTAVSEGDSAKADSDSGQAGAGQTATDPTAAQSPPAVSTGDTSGTETDVPSSPGAGVDPSTDPSVNSDSDTQAGADPSETGPAATRLPPDIFRGPGLTPLNPENTVLLDLPNKRLLLKTHVCLDQGMLEMLLCLKQTKEHESILSIDSRAYTIHTGLLALGAESGKSATWTPEFQPATGQIIDIFMHYVDTSGKLQRVPAMKWIRKSRFRYYEAEFETLPDGLQLDPDGNLRYDDMNKVIFWYGPMTDAQRDDCLALCPDPKFQQAIRTFHQDSQPREMQADWVFVGSGFFDDDGVKRYLAEGGYVVCVANFGQALIDVSVSSSADGQETLVFEAWHERLPPLGSEVLVELVPRQKTGADRQKTDAGAKDPAPQKAVSED